MKNAIILCSGGLDSIVTAYHVKKKEKYEKLIFLFFNYGQRNLFGEKNASKKCAKELGAEFKEIELNFLKEISTSLLNTSEKAKEIRDLKNTKEESEKWYVPCRNSLFINYAFAIAESIFIKEKKESDIFAGFKNEGEEYYPDTTKEFVNKINELNEISCIGKFKLIAPLIEMDKEDIILLGKELGVNLKETFSCYVGPEKHCGKCISCQLRKKGFYWANTEDKTEYAK